ncbi:metal-dependent hydrolase [Halobacteriales archaeon Cl-PHB]
MWPWAHAAVGYLLYVTLARYGDAPLQGWPVYATLLGTQLPDLVDKPLAWTIPLLPSGRSLAHSLFAAAVVASLAYYLLTTERDQPAIALGLTVGYVSHLFADGLGSILATEWQHLSYLGWPLLDLPEYDIPKSFVAHFQNFAFEPMQLLGFALTGIAFLVWLAIRHASQRSPRSPEPADEPA